MSAEHEHGHDPGGHELEAINTKLLFRLLVSLSLVTFLACVAVVQWFNSQRRELQSGHAAEGSFMLKAHDAKMGKALEGIDRVAMDVASNPALLAAPPAPPGWIHPDDLVGGAAAKPAEPVEQKPAPAPVPEEAPIPVEAPKGEEPAKEEPAKEEPAKDDKPANDKPADKKPADKKPANDKPEDGE